MMLLAFWVPTMEMEYTGCVWPPDTEPVKGDFWTGSGDFDRVSQSRTCPL